MLKPIAMELQATSTPLLAYIPKTSLTVISAGHVMNIAFADILSIRSQGLYTIIYTAEKEYKTSYSLQELLHDLPILDFFRVSRSRIVCRALLSTVFITNHYKLIAIQKLQRILDQSVFFCQPMNYP